MSSPPGEGCLGHSKLPGHQGKRPFPHKARVLRSVGVCAGARAGGRAPLAAWLHGCRAAERRPLDRPGRWSPVLSAATFSGCWPPRWVPCWRVQCVPFLGHPVSWQGQSRHTPETDTRDRRAPEAGMRRGGPTARRAARLDRVAGQASPVWHEVLRARPAYEKSPHSRPCWTGVPALSSEVLSRGPGHSSHTQFTVARSLPTCVKYGSAS